MPVTAELLSAINSLLQQTNTSWDELRTHLSPPPALLATTPKTQTFNAAEFDSEKIKPLIEAVLKSNCRKTPAAQTFLAQTFARASQHPTVRLSPKQWEWMDKLMSSAGVVMPDAVSPEDDEIPF